MISDPERIKKSVEQVATETGKEEAKNFEEAAQKAVEKGILPKDVMGLSDAMIEGIYGQAYRLYNTGKYKDASQLFRLLIMLDSTEPKYSMGMAACFHMLKEYESAVQTYTLCSIIDPKSPLPHFHASDCYIQMKDPISAIIALEMAIKRAGGNPEFTTLKDRAEMTIKSLKRENAEPKTEK